MTSARPGASTEQWRSRTGFILAAIGSAVGLGNIWRFSHVAGENGGATFILVYILAVLLIGLPIVIAETAIGRRAQADAVTAYQRLAPGTIWVVGGAIAVLTGFLILSYYGVVAGWTLKYLADAVFGGLADVPAGGYGESFGGFISGFEPIVWQAVFMGLTIFVVAGGVEHGIERANRVLMPLLALIVIGLAVYGLTQQGASKGLSFMFSPDWSKLASADIYLAAMGQAFFSLSLGMAVYVTYGAYLAGSHTIPGAGGTVVAGDTLFAIIAGIAVFPAVFAFAVDPAAGPTLVFITLPEVFAKMPGGAVVGAVFFFLLVAAALTSAVSLLEVCVAFFLRRFGWGRPVTACVIGAIIFLIGVPSSLGFGAWSGVKIGGLGILDSVDFLASNILLPLGGLIVALFVGARWHGADALTHSDFHDRMLGKIWLFLLRYVAPVLIVLVFLRAVELI